MIVTGLGSMPGTDFRATLGQVLELLPELPFLPELPERGPGAGMVGRGVALFSGLAADLQPSGWRLSPTGGHQQAAARDLLRHDCDDLTELAAGRTGAIKLSVCGPWTLAACLELPRGGRVLGDAGARRDCGQALAEGLATLLADLRTRLPQARWIVQVDEPMLPMIQAGTVATISGLGRHAAVAPSELTELLDTVRRAAGEHPALHCCAAGLDRELVARAGFGALSLDLSTLDPAAWGELGEWLGQGHQLWAGLLPTDQPGRLPGVDALLDRTVMLLDRLELDASTGSVLLTPACGLAGWSPAEALSALRQLQEVAELIAERMADR